MALTNVPGSVLAVRILLFVISFLLGLLMGARHYPESPEAATVVATGWFFIFASSFIVSWTLTSLVLTGLTRWLKSLQGRADKMLSTLVCPRCGGTLASCPREPRRSFWTSVFSRYAKVSLHLISVAMTILAVSALVVLVSSGGIPHWTLPIKDALMLAAVWSAFGSFVAFGLISFLLWAEFTLWRARNATSRTTSVSMVKRVTIDHVALPIKGPGRILALALGTD